MPPHSSVEHEVTLIIASEAPGQVADHIAGLPELAGYPLVVQPARAIRDLHFDTPDRALEARNLALRVRGVDGQTLISLKGPARSLAAGGVARPEFERPWSAEALEAALLELAAAGIALPARRIVPEDQTPRHVLESMGLLVIQDRETRRVIRHIVEAGEGGGLLAEMGVDAVTFHLSGMDVRHHEVEIEAASQAGRAVLAPLAAALLERYGPALRVGLQSKLAVGRVLERWQREGVLASLLGQHGALMPAAYDRINAGGGA